MKHVKPQLVGLSVLIQNLRFLKCAAVSTGVIAVP